MERRRRRSRTDRFLRPRLPAAGDDRISALPDDLLLLVLRRLDTRTALAAGLLSRRWAGLPRELPALDLRVDDILPPRYRRWALVVHDMAYKGNDLLYRHGAMTDEFLPGVRRYERRAMRALTSSVKGLLAADDGGGGGGGGGGRPRRSLSRLTLEFFITHNTGPVDRLISTAIDAWGVQDLEAVAKPFFFKNAWHAFPSHGLCHDPRASRLRSLKLGGCALPPLHEYGALTTLVLQAVPDSPAATYEGIFTGCPQLQVLHLKSCGIGWDNEVVVDAPRSQIRELVLDDCHLGWLRLRALPYLERLASLSRSRGTTRVYFESTSFPCLRQWNFACHLGVSMDGFRQYLRQHLELDMFFRCTPPNVTNLIIRFTGPDRWVVPSSSPVAFLPNLRRLLVTDVPSSWDVAWPRALLEMAPSLESFHIHIALCIEKPSDEISWQPTKLQQHRLKEFVMVGFEGTKRQIYLIKFVMGVCTALRHVAMFKKGHAQDKGHWDWEMVTQEQSWTDEEKDTALKLIMDGVSSTTAPVKLFLG